MHQCRIPLALFRIGVGLLVAFSAGLLFGQTSITQPLPSGSQAAQPPLDDAQPSQTVPASTNATSSSQLASLLPAPLLEIAQLRRVSIPFACDFTIDACTSVSVPALDSGPIAMPEHPESRTEGRIIAQGKQVDIRKREFAWREGKWRPTNESRQVCDGKRFWTLQRPAATGLWCPTLAFDDESSETEMLQALVASGGVIGGHFAFFPKGDWLMTALTLPPLNVQVSEDVVGPFPCRKVWFHNGTGQFAFWVDMKRGGAVRQARVVFPGKPVPRWNRLLPGRLARSVEATVYEIRDVELSTVADRQIATAGTLVTRTMYRDGSREHRVEHIRRSNITLATEFDDPGIFVPDLPDNSVVDAAGTSLKYLWQNGKLEPFLDPGITAGVDRSARRIAQESLAAAPSLLRGFPVRAPDAGSTPVLVVAGPSLVDSLCYDPVGPRIGLYCLYAALELVGAKPKPQALFRSEYLRKGNEGSSPEQLAAAAKKNGLQATVLGRMTARSLAASPWPILVQVKSRPYSNKYDGWELYLGARNGQAWIWHPAQPPRLQSFADLTNRWNGSGVVLSGSPISRMRLRWPDIRYGILVSLGLVALMWLARRLARGRSTARLSAGFFFYLRRCCLEAAALVIISLAVGLFWHAVSSGGFLTRHSAAKDIRISRTGMFLPETEIDQVRRIALGQESDILIDARDPLSYYLNHIPKARNVYLLANDAEFRAAVADLPRDASLVIYCSRETCHMSEELASRLAANGFTRLHIFKGGWELWESLEKNLSRS